MFLNIQASCTYFGGETPSDSASCQAHNYVRRSLISKNILR